MGSFMSTQIHSAAIVERRNEKLQRDDTPRLSLFIAIQKRHSTGKFILGKKVKLSSLDLDDRERCWKSRAQQLHLDDRIQALLDRIDTVASHRGLCCRHIQKSVRSG